jgi:hypothetical protein
VKNLARSAKRKLELPGRRDLISAFFWPRAEQYIVAAGWIQPEGQRRKEDKKSIPASFLNLGRRSPLSEPELLPSFAKLGFRGPLSGRQSRQIGDWVSKYGLLTRKKTDRDGDTDLDSGQVNQKPMLIEEFVQEACFARDLQRLYFDIRIRNTERIKGKIKNPRSAVDRELAADAKVRKVIHSPTRIPSDDPVDAALHAFLSGMERDLATLALNTSASFSRAPNALLWHAERVLCRLLSEKLEGVRLRVASGFGLPEEVRTRPLGSVDPQELAEAERPPARYRPIISWSCVDLRSAIYLQFLLQVTNDRPMQTCANRPCGAPFSPTRSDQVYCTKNCKQQAKYVRQKGS